MNLPKAKRLSFLCLAVFLLPAPPAGAEVLTLIPQAVYSTDNMTVRPKQGNQTRGLVGLNFQTNSMPGNATITGVELVLYCEELLSEARQSTSVLISAGKSLSDDEFKQLAVKVEDTPWVPEDLKAFGLQLLASATLPDDMEQNDPALWQTRSQVSRDLKPQQGFTLILGASGGNQGRTFYSDQEAESIRRPRLIINYETAANQNRPNLNRVEPTDGGDLDLGDYYYVVSAVDSQGESLPSDEQTFTATGSKRTATLSWAKVEGATAYKIYRSKDSGTYGSPALVATTDEAATVTYADAGKTKPGPGTPVVALSQGVAVRSPQHFMPPTKPNQPNPQSAYFALPSTKSYSYAPAFHGGFVYLLTDEKPNKVLSWRGPLGVIAQPTIPLTDPGRHLLVTPSGQLYIVGNKNIDAYQIGSDGRPVLRPDVKVDNETGLKKPAVPTLTANGSVFYVSQTTAEGVTIVGRNPDLQELWKVPVGDTQASTVTVGPSGQFVYVVTAQDGLVTIDARTGAKFVNALPNQNKLKINAGRLHAPVVIRQSNGVDKVYVAANSADSGVLVLFNNDKTTTRTDADDNDDAWQRKLAALGISEEWTSLTGRVGQPLVTAFDSNKVYFVHHPDSATKLVSLDWLTGAPTPQDFPTIPVGKDGYLFGGGNLATDKGGNIFLFNGEPGQSHLSGFTASLDPLFPPTPLVVSQSNLNLFFGTDGTLYAGAIGTAADLQTVVPQYTLGADTRISDISSPTHLRVTGTADKSETQWTLSARENVLLGNGFRVTIGTSLTIKKQPIASAQK